jgi:hypothetical protein
MPIEDGAFSRFNEPVTTRDRYVSLEASSSKIEPLNDANWVIPVRIRWESEGFRKGSYSLTKKSKPSCKVNFIQEINYLLLQASLSNFHQEL